MVFSPEIFQARELSKAFFGSQRGLQLELSSAMASYPAHGSCQPFRRRPLERKSPSTVLPAREGDCGALSNSGKELSSLRSSCSDCCAANRKIGDIRNTGGGLEDPRLYWFARVRAGQNFKNFPDSQALA